MNVIDELLANNTAFAEALPAQHLDVRPRRSPFLLHRDVVRGFVYDVDTHVLREVHIDEPDRP